jgi:hypothetical protein
MLLASLSKLIKFFINDDSDLKNYKDNSSQIINGLLSSNARDLLNQDDFRKDLIKYCLQDCISLWHILDKFNQLIFDKYQLNIHNYPALASLAFAIFRSHFLKTNKIPKITGAAFTNIQKSYTGGHCDVYHLYSNKECRLYDFVSLYPSVML